MCHTTAFDTVLTFFEVIIDTLINTHDLGLCDSKADTTINDLN